MAHPAGGGRVMVIGAVLACLLILTIIISAGMGFVRIHPVDILRIIASSLSGNAEFSAHIEKTASYVLMDVRLPRILTAALVGAGLAVAGVVYQGILLNPLADPYTLGISSGAAFGASLALLINITALGQVSTPLFAFVGAVATLFVVMRLSSFHGQISAQTLILAGVIIGAVLSAGISLLKYLADEQVGVIVFWLMGSFAASAWPGVPPLAVGVAAGAAIAFFYGRDLNIMSLGRRSSDTLGVETAKIRVILLVTASLVTALCVAVSGVIGFIGLIIPHLMRFLVGPDNRGLIVASALAGAALLLAADTITRAALPVEVPIGVLTALIGGPFFALIFRRKLKARTYE
ncbi:MAG: iron ABC transporter permease [Desulfobulbaceae bacterium]|nr:iron ABC transporter permease [Desulfobulbaceae bacterium]